MKTTTRQTFNLREKDDYALLAFRIDDKMCLFHSDVHGNEVCIELTKGQAKYVKNAITRELEKDYE